MALFPKIKDSYTCSLFGQALTYTAVRGWLAGAFFLLLGTFIFISLLYYFGGEGDWDLNLELRKIRIQKMSSTLNNHFFQHHQKKSIYLGHR